MERYQLHNRFLEYVLPLEGNAQTLRQLSRLPFSGFACCSPCDGSSETPQVPAFLPRPLPGGEYSWGAYADNETLYVVMDAKEGPIVEALKDREDSLDQLVIFQPEGCWYRTLQVTLDGSHQANTHPYPHGPRRVASTEPEWNWDVERIALGAKHRRTLWRIDRKDLLPLSRNGELRLSLSRTSIRDHESVAWGAYGIWGPRFDECGRLRMEAAPVPPPAPDLVEVTFEYDPAKESAVLNFEWEHGYEESESPPGSPHEKWRNQNWNIFTARVNGRLQSFSFSSPTPSLPFSLKPGFNEIHISSRGGTGLRTFLEIAPDDRILPHDEEIASKPFSAERPAILAWIGQELERVARSTVIPWTRYHSRAASFGATVAMWHAHFDPNDRWKNWMEELGEFTLSLQREDGTFSGFHLDPSGQTDVRWRGGAYDSGQVGEFWVHTYQATGRSEFLEASDRLVRAYGSYRVEFNPNYAAFAIFHLAEHYRLTANALALSHLEYYLEHCVARHILPLGFHGGHNYYTVYASIILRAMAMAAAVLPPGHSFHPRLLNLIRRMTNQTLARLQPDGCFDSRDRHFNGETQWNTGLFAVAPVLDGKDRQSLEDILRFILVKAMHAGPENKAPLPESIFSQPLTLASSPSLLHFLLHNNE